MIFTKRPVNFSPRFEVVSCFFVYDDRFLLLKRSASAKLEPGKWGLPAGKKDKKETEIDAMMREAQEETGLKLSKPKFKQHHTLFVRYPEYSFTYHPFHVNFTKEPEITLNAFEHQDYTWVTPEEALKMDLVRDLDACIKLFFKIDK